MHTDGTYVPILVLLLRAHVQTCSRPRVLLALSRQVMRDAAVSLPDPIPSKTEGRLADMIRVLFTGTV